LLDFKGLRGIGEKLVAPLIMEGGTDLVLVTQFRYRCALKTLEGLRQRLHKLYDALKTGKLHVEDLAPRIKKLKAQIGALEENHIDLLESIREAKVDLLETFVFRASANDFKALLSKGSIFGGSHPLTALTEKVRRDCVGMW
jgi:hypothetical protein